MKIKSEPEDLEMLAQSTVKEVAPLFKSLMTEQSVDSYNLPFSHILLEHHILCSFDIVPSAFNTYFPKSPSLLT